MAALTPLVQQCDTLDGQAVGNALYGLQGIGDSNEVRALVAVLSKKVHCSFADTMY